MRTGRRLLLVAALVVAVLALTTGSVLAALEVNVMPSGVTSKINTWDSGPYTWPGNALNVWGNVEYDGAGSLSYTWVMGDGGVYSGPVSDPTDILINHTYATTGSYVVTLTVTDGTETDSDTLFIDVVPKTLDVETNLAIQKGLKYLYEIRRNATAYNSNRAYYWPNYATVAGTALSVMAFENHGHLEKNDPTMDIYSETVKGGLNYLFYYMRPVGATDNPPYDSDINGNGLKTYCGTYNMYHVGITAMAIAATIDPTAVVSDAGYAPVVGMTYQELLEDMVDYIAYAQEDRNYVSGFGAWRYTPNANYSDNSVAQWPALGLGEAERAPWNIHAPAWVKSNLPAWINNSQCSNGGFGYTSTNYWCNVAKTGAGIVQMVYAGAGGNMNAAINFIAANWGATAYDYDNFGDHYAMYAVKKGLEYANLSSVGGHDWQEEYNQWYVNTQYTNGNWPSSTRIASGNLSTSLALLVMAPLEVCKPLAEAGIDVEASQAAAVAFDGSGSTHTCSNSIVLYEWDFDYDGVNFDVDAVGYNPVNSSGYTITNGTDTQQFVVALRVTDDQVPAKVSLDTLVVTVSNGNIAPVADPGGPYLGAVGEDITLDGSGSYDENSATGSNPIMNPATASGYDEVVLYQWDIDGDGLYGTDDSPADPEGVAPVVNFGPSFLGTKTVQLKVTDSFGKSAVQSVNATTVAVSDLYPVGYELVQKLFNRRTRLWTISYKVYLLNSGNGVANNVSATLTPTNIPPGVVVNDGSIAWSGTLDPAETQLSDDTFTYTYTRELDLTTMTWDISFVDALGANHVVRNVLQ